MNFGKKTVQKSVRMAEKVYQAVDEFDGDGFNDKFENLVGYCIYQRKAITKNIDYLMQKKEVLLEELNNLEEAEKVIKDSMMEFVDIGGTLGRIRRRLDAIPELDIIVPRLKCFAELESIVPCSGPDTAPPGSNVSQSDTLRG